MLSNKSNKELVEAGHQFAKALNADMPLTEIAKLVSALSARLDCAIVRGDELQQKLDAMASENAALKAAILRAKDELQEHYDTDGVDSQDSEGNFMDAYIRLCDAQSTIEKLENIKPPTTDAYLNSVRAEGIHFAANRMLAAWECGFINDTPEQVHDISGAVLSALEFLPNASPEEFKRDYADEVRASIAEQLRSGTHDTADKVGAK